MNVQGISVSVVTGFGLNDLCSILTEAAISIYLLPTTSRRFLGVQLNGHLGSASEFKADGV